MFSILNYKCEKCKVKDNITKEFIFNFYPVFLCSECKREFEAFLLPNPDWKLFQAIKVAYPTSLETEKIELEALNRDVLRELKIILEVWLRGSGA